ncbi:MAG TPA: energy transducer TonB [Tahibacter sp.]|nr:energy transducer TonB [Tahibacter sp.]
MRPVVLGLLLCAGGVAAADDDVRVVDEKNLSTLWVRDAKQKSWLRPYPSQLIQARIVGCVAVATLIGSDGRVTPRGVVMVQSNAKKDRQRELLEKTAIGSATALRYVPAPANAARTPVLTYQTFTFAAYGDGRPPAIDTLAAQCAIADFAATVKAKVDSQPAE